MPPVDFFTPGLNNWFTQTGKSILNNYQGIFELDWNLGFLQELLQSHTRIHYFSREKANQSIREKRSDCLFFIRVFIFFFFFFEGIPLPYFYPYPSPSPFGAATYFLGRTLMLSQPPFRYTLFKQLLLDY